MGLYSFLLGLTVACALGLHATVTSTATATATRFTTGHDLSSVGYMETDKGVAWYNETGHAQPVETILGAGGMQSVRLRLWTSDEYGLDYTLALARRFARAGFSIYLNMHFSDTWADPGHQAIPAAWNATSLDALARDLRRYVATTLTAFARAGIPLELLSLGNEVTSGMLFPLGRIDNNDFRGFATLWTAARAGVRDAHRLTRCASPRIMLHVSDGWKQDTMAWFFGGVFATGMVARRDVDVIGVSFYPFYDRRATVAALESSLTALALAYDKPLYVAETDYPSACTTVELSAPYPPSPAGQIQWTQAVIHVLQGLPRRLGAGIFYWEPAYVATAGLGSACESALLFAVDWSGWPLTKATALASVALFT